MEETPGADPAASAGVAASAEAREREISAETAVGSVPLPTSAAMTLTGDTSVTDRVYVGATERTGSRMKGGEVPAQSKQAPTLA